MSYVDADKILAPWLKRHGLHVFTMDREVEVRSIDVVDDTGDRCQITLSEPDASGRVTIFAWNCKSKRKSKSKEFQSTLSELEEALEEAYAQVMEWVKQAGHARTPIF